VKGPSVPARKVLLRSTGIGDPCQTKTPFRTLHGVFLLPIEFMVSTSWTLSLLLLFFHLQFLQPTLNQKYQKKKTKKTDLRF
jgi:hypothetical protein